MLTVILIDCSIEFSLKLELCSKISFQIHGISPELKLATFYLVSPHSAAVNETKCSLIFLCQTHDYEINLE